MKNNKKVDHNIIQFAQPCSSRFSKLNFVPEINTGLQILMKKFINGFRETLIGSFCVKLKKKSLRNFEYIQNVK